MVLALLLTGCAGTFLTEVQAGYATDPLSETPAHAGTLVGHIGGSEAYGVGIGLTARARAMTNGFAFPELGPQAFVLVEEDGPVGFYTRLSALVGFGMLEEQLGPVFSLRLNPGVMIWPADDPLFLSLSLVADGTAAPATPYTGAWFGVMVGMGVGGRSTKK